MTTEIKIVLIARCWQVLQIFIVQKGCHLSHTSWYRVTATQVYVFTWLWDVIVHLSTGKKRHSFYIARPSIWREAWLRLRMGRSSWTVTIACILVFLASCVNAVWIWIYYVSISARSDILFNPSIKKSHSLLSLEGYSIGYVLGLIKCNYSQDKWHSPEQSCALPLY